MSKRAPAIGIPKIVLEQHTQAPLHRQLYERLRDQVLAGRLEAGSRLPSTRVLAGELGVSRTTTALAYEQLLLEGYAESRVGDGTRVARLRPEPPVPPVGQPDEEPGQDATGLGKRGRLLRDIPFPEAPPSALELAGTRLFPVGQPDSDTFPYETWARLVARRARQSLRAAANYQDVLGYPPLREAIAAHIGITRGVQCSPEQIILTTGAQGALALIARALLDPGDPVWLEDPGYSGARGALLAAGAKVIAVPVDHEGLDVEAGRASCPEARLAVVTPSHQFPTGVTMSLSRRLALLAWAGAARAWVVEDDYDSEYRYGGRPLEALQCLDGAGRVIYVGTFSKVLFPSLRLGYLVAPSPLLDGLFAAHRFGDIHVPVLEQMALADFLGEGHFARHVRNMRQQYRARRDVLAETLAQEAGGMLEVAMPQAGLHLVATLPAGMSGPAVAARAATHGLHVPVLSQFSARTLPRDGLLLGFASATPEELRIGARTLAGAVRAAAQAAPKDQER